MKNLIVILGLLLAAGESQAQTQPPTPPPDKPRVFVTGAGNVDVRTNGEAHRNWYGGVSGSSHSTVGKHDQTMELANDFPKQCPGVIVTLNNSDADYTVSLNHEAFHGVIFKNNQIMITNRRGDLVMSNKTRAVSHSVNDSCSAILADWKANGRLPVPALAPEPAPASQVSAASPLTTQAATSRPQTTQPDAAPAAATMTPPPESLGEIARRNKQHKACLELAKTNPSVTCKD